MAILALVRHGQSLWNKENRFTGWVDVPLTHQGEQEAHRAAMLLENYKFDIAYTSMLIRAQHTLHIIESHIPIIRDQALNERHYGDLQGMNKDDARQAFGEEQVKIWRRSYDICPPNGESLKDTAARTLPFFKRCIMGDLRQGKNVLVVAHGNSNRSIVMLLDKLSNEEVIHLELPTGAPVIYEFDSEMNIVQKKNLV